MKQNTPAGGDMRPDRGSRKEFWRRMIRRFAASGQNVRVFCQEQGFSQPSFYSWRRRLAGEDAASSPMSRSTSMPAFLPVQVAQENSPGIEIVLRGDRRIRLCGTVDRSTLAEVVATLESLPFPESTR